ncbi:MAG: hypothetical protein L0H41_01420 [Microlunatus sp.]|nr:hypothetical protein [Microlunatus sp.]MDN5769638.1 hypothetical protein [Microlunatus sp.]MDN5803123.1 hypothetical protein [Microlunatus sp.]
MVRATHRIADLHPLDRLARAGFAVHEGPGSEADLCGHAVADDAGKVIHVEARNADADLRAAPDTWIVDGEHATARRARQQALTVNRPGLSGGSISWFRPR